MYDEEPVEVPYGELPAATLRAVVEDFCTRDGTDYSDSEMSLEQKIALLMGQLERGEAHLVFEANSQTLGIVTERTLRGGRGG